MSDASSSALHGESARRQFRVSLYMVIALALAAMVTGFVTPSGAGKAAATGDAGQFVGRLVAMGE
ncbi:MAG: hypothetical protein ACR652_08240 [Methylocystis sp.]|uniref:hypothetical protein n=1 Tax=Methylocystis sp. TaxID=1911079 RepID=UPI003DA59B87